VHRPSLREVKRKRLAQIRRDLKALPFHYAAVPETEKE
jgi:hypothetical protein